MFAFLLSSVLLLFVTIGGAEAADVTVADVIAAVTPEEWDDAVENKIVVTINDVDDYNFNFSPSDFSLVAGNAYVLRVENNASNVGKHYYSALELFATSAMRKIQSPMAEMKADFLGDLELLTSSDGGTTAPWAEYFFVPMVPGSYYVFCSIADHEARGMNGTITVTDDNNITDTLITDWASDYTVDSKTSPDPRRSGDHEVWTDRETVEVEILSPYANMTGYAFRPSNIELTVDQGYVLRIFQTGDGIDDKHYFTATDFFRTVVTRKLQDDNGEFKFPYINAVELTDIPELAGQLTYIDLYIVPTVPGLYDVICTIDGHAAAGMNGTITVLAADVGGGEEESEDGTSGVCMHQHWLGVVVASVFVAIWAF